MNEPVPETVSYGDLVNELRKRIRQDRVENKDYLLDLLYCLHHLEERTYFMESQKVGKGRRR